MSNLPFDPPTPEVTTRCDHKMIDSTRCLKCGWTPPEVTPPTSIGVYADTRGTSRCRGAHCDAAIEWATVVTTGRRMCFNRQPTRTAISYERGSNRRIDHLDLASNHWATCPDAALFHAQRTPR